MSSKLDFSQFQELNFDSLLTADWGKLFSAVREAMLDPSSNLPVAILVLIITSILITILLVLVLIFVMGSREDEDDYVSEDAVTVVVGAVPEPVYDEDGNLLYDEAAAPGEPEIEYVFKKKNPWVTAAITLFVLAFSWWALAYGTSRDDICLGCHTETPHTEALALLADKEDAKYVHADANCVDCHEPDGLAGPYGFEVLYRSMHFVFGFELVSQNDYGAVTEDACLDCHSAIGDNKVEKNDKRGVFMSHGEPREAGWRCVDCHELQEGLLVDGTQGMTNCVSCHDNTTASAACDSCHYKDVAVAASAEGPEVGTMASALVPIPNCGGCHNEATECDPCHNGVRMPHTSEFRRIGHARVAAEDFWFGSGNACFGCHTKTRNQCGNCHSGQFWSHQKTWATVHAKGGTDSSGCRRCHDRTIGARPDRNFCVDVCHQERTEWLVH